MSQKTACIIGAGPAGLTAALQFVQHTDIKPIIVEMTADVGGISQTINYKGNRIDIGGHRFFSKSDRVMQMWTELLPLETAAAEAERTDKVMLVRSRLSRILFLRRFFNYPLALNVETLRKLGFVRTMKIGVSYLAAKVMPVSPEVTLEDFFINRFGRELYGTFFKDYTEKVWGVACSDIPRDWGAQRVKGLSVFQVLWHAVKKALRTEDSLAQKKTETSLIDRFFYPKHGPGQLWEAVAEQVKSRGGEIRFRHKVIGVDMADGNRIQSVVIRNEETQETITLQPDYCLSSMPVRDLIASITTGVPAEVSRVAKQLMYRDFITVGILLPKDKYELLPDNWIYVQERDVLMGRIQVFNNWSPFMVSDAGTIWLGIEYFCNEGDALWNKDDQGMKELVATELKAIGLIQDTRDVLDAVVIRMPKAYPAYFGSYKEFGVIRQYVDQIDNLFLMGRNGMHRYNNMDHSMLTALAAVENIVGNITAKDNIWAVNTEEDYHEDKEKAK